MKSALIDASSAILLHKARLFETMADTYRLSMAPAVYREITVGGHTGVALFRRAKKDGSINVLADSPPIPSHGVLNCLGAGEAETIRAYHHQRVHFIIIDDGKGARSCRTQKIPYINALLCPNLLYWSNIIDAETRWNTFVQIQHTGRYAHHIVDFAQNTTATAMRHFLP
jgi:hypothetical protein